MRTSSKVRSTLPTIQRYPMLLRPTILIAATFTLSASRTTAQDKTKEGDLLTWTHTISVVPDSLANAGHTLPAFLITVYESDGGQAFDLWKAQMASSSREVNNGKPAKAIGVTLPAFNSSPVMVLCTATTDKKADLGRLSLAYVLNDSVPVMDQEAASAHARELAVALNKAVVQVRIDAYTKRLDKTNDKLDDAQEEVMDNAKDLEKANKDLAKNRNAVSKIQADNAKYSGEIAGLEKKFALTNDPKDLKQLTKARQKLAKGEASLAKAMKSEAKAQDAVSRYQGRSPDHARTAQEHTDSKEEIEAIIAQLKRKQDAIR